MEIVIRIQFINADLIIFIEYFCRNLLADDFPEYCVSAGLGSLRLRYLICHGVWSDRLFSHRRSWISASEAKYDDSSLVRKEKDNVWIGPVRTSVQHTRKATGVGSLRFVCDLCCSLSTRKSRWSLAWRLVVVTFRCWHVYNMCTILHSAFKMTVYSVRS